MGKEGGLLELLGVLPLLRCGGQERHQREEGLVWRAPDYLFLDIKQKHAAAADEPCKVVLLLG